MLRLVPDLFNPNERSGLHRFGFVPLMGWAADQVTTVTVFQDDNNVTDILWKKMRDDRCPPLDRSLSSGSLAGQNSPPSKHGVPTRDLPQKGKRDHFSCLHLRCGDGEDDASQHVFISQLTAATQEVPVHRKYHRRRTRGTLHPKELQLPAV